ncbi:MAG: hypothetical protein R2701_02935 [Acidimicrobiales bacterium]
MIVADNNVFQSLWVIVCNIAKGFANVAFTSSLIVMFVTVGVVVLYAKKRPVGTSLCRGGAMASGHLLHVQLFGRSAWCPTSG